MVQKELSVVRLVLLKEEMSNETLHMIAVSEEDVANNAWWDDFKA